MVERHCCLYSFLDLAEDLLMGFFANHAVAVGTALVVFWRQEIFSAAEREILGD
eukprot:COSAG01_NODE_17221_length_1168_cov_6.585594_1_plen_54_part_00